MNSRVEIERILSMNRIEIVIKAARTCVSRREFWRKYSGTIYYYRIRDIIKDIFIKRFGVYNGVKIKNRWDKGKILQLARNCKNREQFWIKCTSPKRAIFRDEIEKILKKRFGEKNGVWMNNVEIGRWYSVIELSQLSQKSADTIRTVLGRKKNVIKDKKIINNKLTNVYQFTSNDLDKWGVIK